MKAANWFALVLMISTSLLFGCEGSDGNSIDLGDGREKVDQFLGTWLNEDTETGGITKVTIRVESSLIYVHMWGRCHPSDCDWGEVTTLVSDADDDRLSLEWYFSFAIDTQTVSALAGGRLRVDGHTHFIDDSGRSDYDYTHYFRRA